MHFKCVSWAYTCLYVFQLFISSLQDTHLDFVVAAANLKAEIYGIKQVRDRAAVKKMADSIKVPEFKPRSGVKISVTDADLEASNGSGGFGKLTIS